MAHLPELSELTKRKLALRCKGLLKLNRLTGEHLHWHDIQREALSRGGRVGPVGGSRGPRGSFRVDERLVDREGILPCIAVAKWRFYDLANEYWGLWSVNAGCEIFEGWLDDIKQQVLGEIASIWMGKSKAIDLWYDRACAPAVESELLLRVEEFERRARSAELKALELATTTEHLERAASATITKEKVLNLPKSANAERKMGRRVAVDAYIEEVFNRTGKRITRTDIWKSARYKSRTEFERWERDDLEHPNKTANQRFTRILTEKPHLNSSGTKPAKSYKTVLGRNIDLLRKHCGWSFDDLAQATGLDKKLLLGHVNGGKGAHPSTLERYAQTFTEKLGRTITVAALES
jgi:hypothetical protein